MSKPLGNAFATTEFENRVEHRGKTSLFAIRRARQRRCRHIPTPRNATSLLFLKEMKARRLLPLFVSSIASHFRAGSVTFTQSENPDELFVERTRAWRLEAAGYGREGCTQEHIANKTPAGDGPIYEAGAEMCTEIATNTSCGRFPATYVVTDVENSLEPANNYCYGYKKDVIKKAREY